MHSNAYRPWKKTAMMLLLFVSISLSLTITATPDTIRCDSMGVCTPMNITIKNDVPQKIFVTVHSEKGMLEFGSWTKIVTGDSWNSTVFNLPVIDYSLTITPKVRPFSGGKFNITVYDAVTGAVIFNLDPWWNTTFANRININISTTYMNATNIAIPIIINDSVWGSTSVCEDGIYCNDSAVTWYNITSASEQPIPYYFEKYNVSNTTGNSYLWVKAPNVSNVAQQFYIYYNNTAEITRSEWYNGSRVFYSFHDFENSTTVPVEAFTSLNSGTITIETDGGYERANYMKCTEDIAWGFATNRSNGTIVLYMKSTGIFGTYMGLNINGTWAGSTANQYPINFVNNWGRLVVDWSGTKVNYSINGTTYAQTGDDAMGQTAWGYSSSNYDTYADILMLTEYIPTWTMTYAFGGIESNVSKGGYSAEYVASVYELTTSRMNLTMFDVVNYSYSNVMLVYNHTPYLAIKRNATMWEYNVTTPFVLTNGQAVNLYWNWSRNDSTIDTTSNYTQTVNYGYTLANPVFSAANAVEGASVTSYIQIQNQTSMATIASIYLNKSGTLTSGTATAYNGTINYYAAFTAPTPTADNENMTLNWTMTVYYGGSTRYQTLSTGNLSVYKLIVTFCGDSNLTSVVYRTFDETTWGYLNYSNYSLKVTVRGGDVTRNYSKMVTYAQNISICVYPTSANYTGDITLYYSNIKTETNSYGQRQWHNYNFRLDNDTKWINVYLLNTTYEYQVEIDTRDINNLLAPNTIVIFQKFNYSLNKYLNMTSIYSGVDAKSTTILDRYDTPYRIVLTDSDGVTLNTYDDYFIVESPTVLRTSTSYSNEIQTFEDITVSCSYSNVTKVLSCSFTDPNQKLIQIRFEVVESGLWGKPTICNETLNNTYSGTFTCDLTSVDAATKGFTYKLIGRLNNYQAYLLLSGNIEKSQPTMYGASGLWLAMLVWMSIFFIGTWKPEVAIGLSVFGFFIAIWLKLIDVGTEGGMIFTAGLAMSFAVLIVWRMKQ